MRINGENRVGNVVNVGKLQNFCIDSAATFYSVSISEPIPIRFGKKSDKILSNFPNRIGFGSETKNNI